MKLCHCREKLTLQPGYCDTEWGANVNTVLKVMVTLSVVLGLKLL